MWGRATMTSDDRLGLTIASPEEGGRFTTWAVTLAPDRAPRAIDVEARVGRVADMLLFGLTRGRSRHTKWTTPRRESS